LARGKRLPQAVSLSPLLAGQALVRRALLPIRPRSVRGPDSGTGGISSKFSAARQHGRGWPQKITGVGMGEDSELFNPRPRISQLMFETLHANSGAMAEITQNLHPSHPSLIHHPPKSVGLVV
jgi:hypothetical protein